jgi:hypothetical protein
VFGSLLERFGLGRREPLGRMLVRAKVISEDQLRKALDIDPDNVATREYLGEGYVSKGQLDLAYLELAEIEQRCGTRCEEYQALEKAMLSARSQY